MSVTSRLDRLDQLESPAEVIERFEPTDIAGRLLRRLYGGLGSGFLLGLHLLENRFLESGITMSLACG